MASSGRRAPAFGIVSSLPEGQACIIHLPASQQSKIRSLRCDVRFHYGRHRIFMFPVDKGAEPLKYPVPMFTVS